MPNQHKTPLVGWHPPADLLARLKTLMERRQVGRSVILNEALAEYLDHHDSERGITDGIQRSQH